MSSKIHFQLEEVAVRCKVAPDLILQFVSHSWIVPVDWDHQVFDEEDIARIRFIHDLQNRLGVNEDAVPVILHLVDQLNHLNLKNKI